MANPIDIHVGALIRKRRLMLNIGQVALAEIIGIKFQQVQKYESGANRVSASRLWAIAKALDVPINFFFEGVPEQNSGNATENPSLINEEGAELIRSYQAMTEAQRRKIFELARVMAATEGGIKLRPDGRPKKIDGTNTSD